MFGGFNSSIKEKDAMVIQRIGVYFRERQEYDKACDLLERVLEVRKRLVKEKYSKGQDSKKQIDTISDFDIPFDDG